MYFTMTTPDGETYYSKQLEGSEKEIAREIRIAREISMLIAEGGSFQLEGGEHIFFSKKVAENSIFHLYTK